MNQVILLDAAYERIDEAIELFLSAYEVAWSGKTVLVKPNMLSLYAPERHVTTNPAVIRSLVRNLMGRGSDVTVGDNPGIGGYGSNEHCARETGLFDASLGRYENIGLNAKRVDVGSRLVDSVSVSEKLLQVDYVISVPKFKTHILTTLSGAVKNHFGIIVGGEKARFHVKGQRPEDFDEILVDIYGIRPPDLVLVDAVVGLEGLGPVGTRTRHIGRLIGSNNGVAADVVMAEMMGVPPESIGHLRLASERNFGPIALSDIEVHGKLEPVQEFLLPWHVDRYSPRRLTYTRNAFRILTKTKLKVHGSRCSACGLCEEKCPVDAIEVDGKATIEQKNCVHCFCCYEICPENAIEVRGFVRHVIPAADKKSNRQTI